MQPANSPELSNPAQFMQIYLPIAEVSVNVLLVLTMGGGGCFLSGMFGVGGGFLMTPLLIFTGVPPAMVVGTRPPDRGLQRLGRARPLAAQERRLQDGAGDVGRGILGSRFGVLVFGILQTIGQIDLVIALSYVLFWASSAG